MGSRGRYSTAVRHESSAIRIVGGVSRSFGSVCDIVTPLVCSHRCSAEEGTSASLLPETAEEVWICTVHM